MMGAAGRGWMMQLLTLWIIMMITAALRGVDSAGGDTMERVAHHRVCCLQLKNFFEVPHFSGKPLRDLAELANRISNSDRSCVHEFGVNNLIREGTEYDGPLPPRTSNGNEWTFQDQFATLRSLADVKKAQCATVALFVPVTSKPLKTSVDFFTPDVLEELTFRRPRIRVEEGIAELVMENGDVKIAKYNAQESHSYSYEKGYEDSNGYKFATEKELGEIVTRRICEDAKLDSYSCENICRFVEAVTGTRIPEEYEVGLLTKEELKKFLTYQKLRSLDYMYLIQKLKTEVEKHRGPGEGEPEMSWAKWVPGKVLDKMRPKQDQLGSKVAKLFVIPKHASRGASLSFLSQSGFAHFQGQHPNVRTEGMSSAFSSTEIANTLPQGARRRHRSHSTSSQGSRDRRESLKVVPPRYRKITNFLLVNSLLAVSNTKYSDLLAAGAMHRLQRMRMPLFSVCGEKIRWEPQEAQSRSSSADWLLSNYRFTMTGSRNSSFGYQRLDELDHQTNLSDSSQCAILALVGVPEKGFKDLMRQSFDAIFSILERDQTNNEWRIQVAVDTGKRQPVSTASDVDPWKLVPAEVRSSLTLEQVFDQAAEFFKDNRSLEPLQTDTTRRSSSKRSRSSGRSQIDQTMAMAMNQPQAISFAMM